MADFRSAPNLKKMGEEWSRKLMPLWAMTAEMYRNEDFWGTRIFSERALGQGKTDYAWQVFKEGLEYLAKQAQPFSVRAGERLAQHTDRPAPARLAPWFGFVPAPRYATQSPAEALASEYMRAGMPAGGMTKEQTAHARAVSQLVGDLRKGRISDRGEFIARGRGVIRDQAELTRIQRRALWTPMQVQVYYLPLDKGMKVFDLASERERLELAPALKEKIDRQWRAGRLDEAITRRYVQLVGPYYLKVLAARRPAAAAPATTAAAQ